MEQVIISWISFCLVTVSMYVCLPNYICTCISFNHFFTLKILLHVYMPSFIYGFKYVLI